jgi:hypothetical protein
VFSETSCNDGGRTTTSIGGVGRRASRAGREAVRENARDGSATLLFALPVLAPSRRLIARDSARGGNSAPPSLTRSSGRTLARDDMSRETGVGVGGCSAAHPPADETVEVADPGILVDDASFFRALACTHWTSSANARRSDTGRVRGTERGAVRGAVGGEMPRRGRRGVKRWVAGGAECCRKLPVGLRVAGASMMAGGGSAPK